MSCAAVGALSFDTTWSRVGTITPEQSWVAFAPGPDDLVEDVELAVVPWVRSVRVGREVDVLERVP